MLSRDPASFFILCYPAISMSFQSVATNISRFDIEDKNVHGYMVRMSRQGKRVSKFFSDSHWGSKKAALQAAKETQAKLLKQLGPIQSSTRGQVTSRNSTGQVGVHVAYSVDSRYTGCEYYAYCASWVGDDGKRKKVSFAWNRYGKENAWELACLAREKLNTDRDKVVALLERKLGKKLTLPESTSKKSSTATSKVTKTPAKKKGIRKAAPKAAASKASAVKAKAAANRGAAAKAVKKPAKKRK